MDFLLTGGFFSKWISVRLTDLTGGFLTGGFLVFAGLTGGLNGKSTRRTGRKNYDSITRVCSEQSDRISSECMTGRSNHKNVVKNTDLGSFLRNPLHF